MARSRVTESCKKFRFLLRNKANEEIPATRIKVEGDQLTVSMGVMEDSLTPGIDLVAEIGEGNLLSVDQLNRTGYVLHTWIVSGDSTSKVSWSRELDMADDCFVSDKVVWSGVKVTSR